MPATTATMEGITRKTKAGWNSWDRGKIGRRTYCRYSWMVGDESEAQPRTGSSMTARRRRWAEARSDWQRPARAHAHRVPKRRAGHNDANKVSRRGNRQGRKNENRRRKKLTTQDERHQVWWRLETCGGWLNFASAQNLTPTTPTDLGEGEER